MRSMKLLILLSIFPLIHCSCPAGFQLVSDGQCRGKTATTSDYMDVVVKTAISKCGAINAIPLTIHNDEEYSYWSREGGNYYVMGLVCNTVSKKWEWSDGSSVDFKPPPNYYWTDLDAECKTGCSWFIGRNGTGVWYIDCTHTYITVDFNCVSQLEQPIASTDCGNFDDDSDDNVCYEVAAKAETWKDAQTICHSFGAEVASVHNSQENSYVRRLAVSRGATNGVLIGGTVSGKANDFGWIDGSDWDYTNFYPGFPIDGLGDCLSMDTLVTSGEWMNTNCASKLPVVCSRRIDASPETACSVGTWKEGQIIYSPGFPNNASIPCDFFFTVAAGKKVKLQIMLLEANTCCDHLLITDGYIGGTIMANLTGEISNKYYTTSVSNTMRVSWQPDGGVNVRGVMMSFTAA